MTQLSPSLKQIQRLPWPLYTRVRLFSHDILHTHCLKPDLFRLRESQHKITVLLCIRRKGLLRAFQPVSCRTLQSHASARQIATLTRPFGCETVQLSEGKNKKIGSIDCTMLELRWELTALHSVPCVDFSAQCRSGQGLPSSPWC